MRLTAEYASRLYSDRACTPEETLARAEPFLRHFGITRLARLTSLDRIGIPVWNAVVPNARSIVINQGKGLTDIDAKVSAAMEALERAVAGNPCLESITASGDALSAFGHKWDALPSLTGFGQSDITPAEELRWVEGTELHSGEAVFVPYEAAILDRTMPGSRFWQSSDGLASGNTAGEAVFHALLERIERDAYVLWQVSQDATSKSVDPASFGDHVVKDLTAKIEAAGLMLRLFDITADTAVPVYAAFIAPSDIQGARFTRFADVAQGCGAHPDGVRAVLRAITEAAQSRLTYISGARDDISPESFQRPLPESIRRLFDLPAGKVDAVEARLPNGADALTRLVLGRLSAAGITSAIAVRLGDTRWPFHVAKVFVPELENPEGRRKRRLGARAISRSLEIA